MKEPRLTAKQSQFVEEYLIDLNATQAAIRAGYAESTANKQASLWVGKTREACPENMRPVWDAVQEAKGDRVERTQIDADYVLQRMVEIDKMDAADIMDGEGNLLPINQWPSAWRRYISSMDVTEIKGGDGEAVGILKKIKWPDKLKNLELIGKHVTVQAFREQVAHQKETKTLQELLEEVRPERLEDE